MADLDKICPRLLNFAGDFGFAALDAGPLAKRSTAEKRRVLNAMAAAAHKHLGALPPEAAFATPGQRDQLVGMLQFVEREAQEQLGHLAARQARMPGKHQLSPDVALAPLGR